MGTSIGIISIKGGVGKTTIASSLATDLVNSFGKKVLLVDANYSAPNLGFHMDIENPESTIHDVLVGDSKISSAIHNKYGVDVIPGNYLFNKEINPLKLRDKLSKIENQYDFVIIDSSPNMNEEILSTMLASDALFVVTTGDYPTLSCSLRAAQLAKQRGKPIAGMIMNKIRDPKYELDIKEIEKATGIPVVAKIPDEKIHTRALFSRIPASLYDRKSKFAKEINSLNSALLGIEDKPGLFRRLFFLNYPQERVNREVLKKSFYSSIFQS